MSTMEPSELTQDIVHIQAIARQKPGTKWKILSPSNFPVEEEYTLSEIKVLKPLVYDDLLVLFHTNKVKSILLGLQLLFEHNVNMK